jgi:hypothetical protein
MNADSQSKPRATKEVKRHPLVVDLSGRVFGRLTVVSFHGSQNHQSTFLCRCACGKKKIAIGQYLTSGRTSSCGCLKSEMCRTVNAKLMQAANSTHGKSNTIEHGIWRGMRARCNNPESECYKNYGGRGISVCERWNSFENFLSDIGPRPSRAHTVERKNNNLGYSPDNCTWGTREEQANNKRTNVYHSFGKQSLTLVNIAKLSGLNLNTIRYRMRSRGITAEAAVAIGNSMPRKRSRAETS